MVQNMSFLTKIFENYKISKNFQKFKIFEKKFLKTTLLINSVSRTGVLGWQHYGRGLGLSSATLAPVASLRLSREPYATARQFA